jgi:PAS domain S-box-containing protein
MARNLISAHSGQSLQTAAICLILAPIYFAASKFGFTMAFAAEQVTVVWPPTGLALAATLLLGYRVWPAIAVGAFLANVTTGAPIAASLGITAGNTLEAVAGVWLLRRYTRFNPAMSRLMDVLGLLVFCAFFATMISATIGVASLCLSGAQPWDMYFPLWLLWWVGDASGALIVAPLLLVWSSRRPALYDKWRALEAITLLAGLIAICLAIFTDPPRLAIAGGRAFIYLIFPFMIWAALRFRQHGATLVTIIACATAVWATLQGLGPFTGTSVNQSLMLLQIFMAVVAVTGLLLSAATAERREAEEVRSRLASIVEYSDDAIIGKDLNNIINFWNAGAQRLFGYRPSEIIGQPIYKIVPPDRRQEEEEIVSRLSRGERIEHYETVRVAKDGRLIDISLSVSPIRDSDGRIVGASKVARDVSDRKKMDARLKDSDRRKDEFLATLAHELRNPLAPLSNALHMLQLPELGEQRRREAYKIMEHQLQQMVRLVDDLLDVSRISHGKIELRRQRIQLKDAITSAMETVRPLIEERRHALTLEVPDEPVWVNADLIRLSQIFANLLNNAVKYTPGGGQIQLAVEAGAREVTVRVRDNGIGIPESDLPKIFDMFTQVDNSIERAQGGLGIGLTLVRNLVQLHGGSIEARSSGINQGSEFVVKLPRVDGPEPIKTSKDKPVSRGHGRRLKVLVVDDSREVAKTLGWMVELLGHEVQVTTDGASALALARDFVPDAVLLDIGLSGMSGYDVCRKMRAEPLLKDTIIIAQTGWGQAEHRQRSKEAGFHYHLVKPVDIHVLEDLLLSL